MGWRDVTTQRVTIRDPVGQAFEQFGFFGFARVSRLLNVVKVFHPTAGGEPIVGETDLGSGEPFALGGIGLDGQ